MLLQTVLLLHTFQLMPSCHGQVFLEQPGPGPVVAPIGTQVQLNCSVMEGYRIEWGVTLPNQTVKLLTDVPGVLDTLRAQGIVVESPDDETSLLVINATESTNETAATCIAINRNNALAREKSGEVQVFFYDVFLEQPGPGPVVASIGTQVQLNCSVLEGYRIEWGVSLQNNTMWLVTDVQGVLDTLRARGIVVESPDNETSLLVINATESTNGTAATCIAVNRNNTLASEESRHVQVFVYVPNQMTIEDASICLVKGITYSIQCSYITGGNARGCVYTLVSGVEGVANITGTIDRNSSERVQVDLPGDFIELLVFDWERDNSTGSVPVRLNISGPELCEDDSNSEVVINSSIALAVTLCVIIILTALIIVLSRRRHKKHAVLNKSSCNNNNDKVKNDLCYVPEENENAETKIFPHTYDDVELDLYEKKPNNAETKFPHIYNVIEPEQSHCAETYFHPVCNVLEGKQEMTFQTYSHLDYPQNESEWTGLGGYEDVVVVSVQNAHYKQDFRDTVDSFRMIMTHEDSQGYCRR